MNDILGDGVGRGSLGSKQSGHGSRGPLSLLNCQIFVNQIQGVELLALVFMEPFDLDVEDGLGIDIHPLGLLQICRKLCFFTGFYSNQAMKELLICCKCFVSQHLQLGGILFKALSNKL